MQHLHFAPATVEMNHYLFDPPHCARINALLPATRYFFVLFFFRNYIKRMPLCAVENA
jgi:hypothetical protein